eukprot:scaffold15481_cov144-Amphora_coffeaeformis.AAC.1
MVVGVDVGVGGGFRWWGEVLQWGGAVGGVGGKGWELVVEEEVVVGVAAEGSSELDGEFGDVHVEESLVGSIGWFAGPERRWEEFQVAAVEFLGC